MFNVWYDLFLLTNSKKNQEKGHMKLSARNRNLQVKTISLTTEASNVAAILNTQPEVGDIALDSLFDSCLELMFFIRQYQRKINIVERKGQRA